MNGKTMAALLLLSALAAEAQEENTKRIVTKKEGFNFLSAGVQVSTTSYINTQTKDSNSVAIYTAPYVDFSHKSGLGIQLKSYALPGGSNTGFYLSAISPYFALYKGNVLPYISYTRYIQHDNASVPYSPIQHEIYAHLRFTTKYADPMMGIDLGFGNDEQDNNKSVSNINAFVAVSHVYLVDNKTGNPNHLFAITPRLQLNAGTDRYFTFMRTTGYISQNRKASTMGYGAGRRTGNGGSGSTVTDTYTISEENNFSLSNMEAHLGIMYFLGNFSIEPSGSLYIPFRGTDKTPYGYWQLNFSYWFSFQ